MDEKKELTIAITGKKTAKDIALQRGEFSLEKWRLNNEIHVMILASLNNIFTRHRQQRFWSAEDLEDVAKHLGVSYAGTEIYAWNIKLNTKQLKRLLMPAITTMQGNGIDGSNTTIDRIMRLVELACITNEQKVIDTNGRTFYPVIITKEGVDEYLITIRREVALWHANQKKEIVLDTFRLKQEGGFYQHLATPLEALLLGQDEKVNTTVAMRLYALILAHKEQLISQSPHEYLAIPKEELIVCLDNTRAIKKDGSKIKVSWKEIYHACETLIKVINQEYANLHQLKLEMHQKSEKGKKGLFFTSQKIE
ncbi:hypothetical protein [Entomospira culicis]|uniref:Uncharacterized protein n=1 Tax=Entomospira culicis TaxID=2719989 RepID=A0A968KVJ7_9SPIO|nr:hypothetical protein [Entomospira culicis]NIZ19993.1 hypothetical protein [Entomospira culicis]NIZ70205.1 hypothetical protein [Entomospira culicis]WDI38100.1 hypothetical protein PVA46_08285 [Entomospira culicis]WDI39722.1 hypothetical protein PVA47_08285 [Entomospira culicis]